MNDRAFKRLYVIVIGELAVLIFIFYIFTRTFR